MRLDAMRTVVTAGIGLLAAGAGVASEDAFVPPARAEDAIRVFLVTGGHDHDIAFYSVLDAPDLHVLVEPYPNALSYPVPEETDVVVLYDQPRRLSDEQRANLRAYVEGGGPVVAVHHAISGRTKWDWWVQEVVGGRWVFEPGEGEKASSYVHDVVMNVRVVADHPVTKGVEDFQIFDETYKDLWISPDVTTLLETDHPTSDGPVAWIGPWEKARIVFIQLGHGREAHLNPSFGRLVRNAVHWAAGAR